MKPVIGISIGDINGVGPEIILKAIGKIDLEASSPLIIAPKQVLDYHAKQLKLRIHINRCEFIDQIDPGFINLLDMPVEDLKIVPGNKSTQSGEIAMQSIELGIELASIEVTQALVTAPISKEAVNLAGYKIPGHTEFLAQKTDTDEVLMMLVSEALRVALVTAHIPISAVSKTISKELILRKLGILDQSLKKDFGIPSPKIAVFGLNPHAGDGGVIGKEEIEVIIPTLKKAQSSGINAEGPFPADGFFGQRLDKEFDAILAMYHDQGLVPFKLLSFGKGVNFTAGLPIIRTSPDHGTAFNIAGKGSANPSSFIQAYELAVQLAKKRYEP
ncbi:MAG: 4-hydroxythreonine-4-phosphate dehydrogenase PdxA [Balneolaceae bacterium]|nr:4-hydroxythreonine-4-phosphate dehydrogenase PdxA [Balneolaceae bacterium]MBO6546350.1 4-hydroxythreonine-4-phosphate dehydrogenase PdxA [Balneolaceae bacterium]MBO6648709.1 4-hydroxythreonine-4-phosphate dehydrogenase PdxA [Balneolaceae bacterium]